MHDDHDELHDAFACAMDLYRAGHGMLAKPLPALGDAEGARVPDDLPRVIDAHVHLFPPAVFEALWRWFERYGWPVRYRLHARQVLDFLFTRGVTRVVGLHYAHKPGMADALNAFIAELAADEPRLTGLATVLPGEPGAADVLDRGLARGLRGVKLHTHVQAFAIDDPRFAPLAEVAIAHDVPMVVHAGREPKSPHYPVDSYAVCHVDRVARVLRGFPRLKLVVPHLGADEFAGYTALLHRHDNLWLDTTMLVGGYFPLQATVDVRAMLLTRPDRVMYGTDFPNLPYAWDRELRALQAMRLPDDALAAILAKNAESLFA